MFVMTRTGCHSRLALDFESSEAPYSGQEGPEGQESRVSPGEPRLSESLPGQSESLTRISHAGTGA
eukprot:431884-Rhodomonas_salina.1